MVIAVTYQEGQVFQHFGHSEFFKLYQVEGDAVVSARVTGTQGAGHGALAGFLREQGAEVLICGGIGAGARTALDQAGTIDTPNGKVDFVQLIGATDAELRAVMDKKLTVRELVEKIGELTDYTRDSVVLGG